MNDSPTTELDPVRLDDDSLARLTDVLNRAARAVAYQPVPTAAEQDLVVTAARSRIERRRRLQRAQIAAAVAAVERLAGTDR